MSDAKVVGVIGQAYEDRTTGKIGVLESRDDERKTLMLIGEDGKGFNVSYSSFKSKWRKYLVSETEECKSKTTMPVVEETTAEFFKPTKVVDAVCILEGDAGTTAMLWRDGFKEEHCILVHGGKCIYATITNAVLKYFDPVKYNAVKVFESDFAVDYELKSSDYTGFVSAIIDSMNKR